MIFTGFKGEKGDSGLMGLPGLRGPPGTKVSEVLFHSENSQVEQRWTLTFSVCLFRVYLVTKVTR